MKTTDITISFIILASLKFQVNILSALVICCIDHFSAISVKKTISACFFLAVATTYIYLAQVRYYIRWIFYLFDFSLTVVTIRICHKRVQSCLILLNYYASK